MSNSSNLTFNTTQNEVPTISPVLSKICGSILMLLAISGMIVYIAFIMIVFKRKKFNKNAYFIIAGWLGIADCVCLVLMIGYAAPCIIMNANLSDTKVIGGILNVGWFTGLPLIGFLALNRYLCICHTELCKKVYTPKLSRYYCIACCVFGVVYSIASFLNCCPLYFDYVLMTWGWDITKHGAVYLSYGELGMVVVVTVGSFGLNLCVLKEIRKAHRNTAPLGASHEQRKLARERKVFFQFFITIIWLVIFDVPFITIGYLEDPSYWLGYFVTVVYTMNCSVNGWVYLLLNKTFQKEFKATFFCLQSSDDDDMRMEGGRTLCIQSTEVDKTKTSGNMNKKSTNQQ